MFKGRKGRNNRTASVESIATGSGMVTYTPCFQYESKCLRQGSAAPALVERHQEKNLKHIPQDESEWIHLLNVWLRQSTMDHDVKERDIYQLLAWMDSMDLKQSI
ncbi:hypothetical protein TNCT_226571 [Trichonephila clavata]|uniref:Uncharacterized protein n=1 Tax=Trichonephila clavata TaxID=2740835 RepID=A0A8X6L928_TRICU|nr:hypothetical protein TNCT_226571 [Trichonephila clavata]